MRIIKKKGLVKETNILKISNSLIRKKLKWYPVLNIMQAVNLTHEWYEHCYLKERKNSFSLQYTA